MKDLTNNINLKRVISPVSVADNTAQVGQIIDRQGYNSIEYVISTGSITHDRLNHLRQAQSPTARL